MTIAPSVLPQALTTTRRGLFTGLGTLIVGLAASATLRLALGRRARLTPTRLRVALPATEGVSFAGDVILVRRGDDVRAYSARCPHLGCRLGRVEGQEIVCACHGSRFSVTGRRLAGPATADLSELAIDKTSEPDRIDVVLAP